MLEDCIPSESRSCGWAANREDGPEKLSTWAGIPSQPVLASSLEIPGPCSLLCTTPESPSQDSQLWLKIRHRNPYNAAKMAGSCPVESSDSTNVWLFSAFATFHRAWSSHTAFLSLSSCGSFHLVGKSWVWVSCLKSRWEGALTAFLSGSSRPVF